jgi:hypothetical protein
MVHGPRKPGAHERGCLATFERHQQIDAPVGSQFAVCSRHVDVSDLIATIDFNLQSDGPTRFQQKVSYDNVPEEALPAWRAHAAGQSLALLESLDRRLSIADRDVNPGIEGTGRIRTGVGIFYFEEPYSEPRGREEKR